MATNGRARVGCLGSLAALVLFGLVSTLLISAVFAPWSFFLGGRFHPAPMWQGWALIHAPEAGGDYRLYVRMTSAPAPAPHISTGLKGDAYLCTPGGERFNLTLGGAMARPLPLNTVGQPVRLHLFNRNGLKAYTTDRRPKLELRGVWEKDALVMTDGASLATAFRRDGSLRPPLRVDEHGGTSPVQVRFEKASMFVFNPRCPKGDLAEAGR